MCEMTVPVFDAEVCSETTKLRKAILVSETSEVRKVVGAPTGQDASSGVIPASPTARHHFLRSLPYVLIGLLSLPVLAVSTALGVASLILSQFGAVTGVYFLVTMAAPTVLMLLGILLAVLKLRGRRRPWLGLLLVSVSTLGPISLTFGKSLLGMLPL